MKTGTKAAVKATEGKEGVGARGLFHWVILSEREWGVQKKSTKKVVCPQPIVLTGMAAHYVFVDINRHACSSFNGGFQNFLLDWYRGYRHPPIDCMLTPNPVLHF